jgi:hypothetical protein
MFFEREKKEKSGGKFGGREMTCYEQMGLKFLIPFFELRLTQHSWLNLAGVPVNDFSVCQRI